jgi:hypothetical protein
MHQAAQIEALPPRTITSEQMLGGRDSSIKIRGTLQPTTIGRFRSGRRNTDHTARWTAIVNSSGQPRSIRDA